MDKLRTRAAALLKRPCCISKDEGRPAAADLIRRYANGEERDDPQFLDQLSRCLRYAQSIATGPEAATWPERDARSFYQRAAAMLEEIQIELSVDRG